MYAQALNFMNIIQLSLGKLINEALKCKTLCALGYHNVNGYLNATLLVGTHFR